MKKNTPHLNYRADIDGLRAIAILLVIGFHNFPQWIASGFIGVDVFFVISGFLISTIIVSDLKQNTFSLFDFYGRRVRRIFPSLVVVLLTCFLFGWFTLLADEFKELGKHIYAGAAFISNFILWGESSYFDNAAETKIFLHLWSLAIEEQFYIFWPIVMWLFWKARFNLLHVTIVLIILSFTANVIEAHTDKIGMFYSPISRFWELLAGSALALFLINKAPATFPAKKIVADMSSTLGALFFIIALWLINKTTVYPGWWALLPILGTVLIIYAGPTGIVNRILSHKFLVWIGLISYPLYLWHWPALAFANIINGKSPNNLFKLITIFLSILLAWLCYKLIEKPIRQLSGKAKKASALLLLGIIICIGALGYSTFINNGFTSRTAANPYSQLTGDIGRDAYLDFIVANFSPCTNEKLRSLSVNDTKYSYRCFQSQPDSDIDIILIGDSHAEHLLPGLGKELKSMNVGSFVQPGLPLASSELFSQTFDLVINDKNIHTVILSAFWMEKIPTNDLKIKDDFISTINALKAAGKKVIVMGDVPNFGFDPKKCKFQRIFSFDENLCEIPIAQIQKNIEISFGVISEALSEVKDVEYINVDSYFCNKDICSMTNNDKLFFRDAHHLNIDGSLYLGNKIYQKLQSDY